MKLFIIKFTAVMALSLLAHYASTGVRSIYFYANDLTDNTSYIMKKNMSEYRKYLTKDNWAMSLIESDQLIFYIDSNNYNNIPFKLSSGKMFTNNNNNEVLIPDGFETTLDQLAINGIEYKVIGRINYENNETMALPVLKGEMPIPIDDIDFFIFSEETNIDHNFEMLSHTISDPLVIMRNIYLAVIIILLIGSFYINCLRLTGRK